MSNFEQQAEFYDVPILLTIEQKTNPAQVFADFFLDYRLSHLREFISQINEVCLTTDAWPFYDPEKRADLILFHNKIEILLEAAFLVANPPLSEPGKYR